MNKSRLLVALVAAGAISPAVRGQDAPATPYRATAESVAILRWYAINQTAAEFSVGQEPQGVAFDGANMWIANYQSGDVTKLRAGDGAPLGTFVVGGTPSFMTFDGANMWVNNGSSLVKLRASDGQQLGAFDVGASPQQMAFDGVSIWVVLFAFPQGAVVKVRPGDGAVLGTVHLTFPPEGIAFDGTDIWVTGNGTVDKIRPSDGALVASFSPGILLAVPGGLAFDGVNMWLADNAGKVVKVRASDDVVVGTFPLPNFNPVDILFDGRAIWVDGVQGVEKLRVTDGAVIGGVHLPLGVRACDGANVWAIDPANNAVRKL
jgi:hypothetical protein